MAKKLKQAKASRRKRPSDGTMALMEHLQELRYRIIVSTIALCLGTLIGFLWYQHSFFGIPSLGEILRRPYCAIPPEKRILSGFDQECRLLATSPFEMFMLRMKVGALAGSVFASPVWLYQLWAFITPGLVKRERRFTNIFVTLAVSLFVAGAVLAYFVLEYGLSFLLTIGDESSVAALTGVSYLNFILNMLLIFGVSFEVPLILVMLNLVGVLRYDHIRKRRDLIWIALVIFAAVMTPGQDPFGMTILGLALCLMVEIALQFMRINDKRREEERPDWLDVDDEAASALNLASGGEDAPQPVAQPAPIAQATPLNSQPNNGFDDVL